jgi:hypothetical protein
MPAPRIVGMEAAIINLTDSALQATLIAADLLLGYAEHCLNYTRLYRKGLLESPKPTA